MRHLFVSSLMAITVILFLSLKLTGRLKLSELNPVSLFGLKAVLLLVGAAFYGVGAVKAIHSLIRYEPTPLVIGVYLLGLVAAAVASFFTMAWLTKED